MNMSKGPYENYYYSIGEPIRNIVKQGQELMCAVKLGMLYQDLLAELDYYDLLCASWTHINNPENGETLWAIDKSRGNTAYPQSLGELCIELAQDYIRIMAKPALESYTRWAGTPWKLTTDLQILRELLYHKNRGTA